MFLRIKLRPRHNLYFHSAEYYPPQVGKIISPRRDYQYDLFVSYNSQDKEEIEDVVTLLKQVGITPWIDWAIRYEQLGPTIERAIDNCRFFAFFLSHNTARSPWLEKETKYFLDRRGKQKPLPFILVKLSDGEMPPSIANLNKGTIHCVDLTKSFLDGVAKLMHIFLDGDIHDDSGLLHYYPSRGEVPPPIWDLLYARANREMRLMGHSLTPAFADYRDSNLISPTLQKGVKMKVILLTPNTPRLQQLEEVQTGVENNVQEKIRKTIEIIRSLKRKLGYTGNESRLQVRVTDKIMYSSISIFDSLALITNYSSREEVGNNSPTFLVCAREHERGSLFSFYEGEFERYWRAGIHPEWELREYEFDDSTRILKHEEQISKIEQWVLGNEKSLPPPAMLIIYPTYECSTLGKEGNSRSLCENCFYRETRNIKKWQQQHLEFDVLASILKQAIDLGIRNFEFSGGGEPLQYKEIKRLLELLYEIKEKSRHEIGNKNEKMPIRYGLLTNGLHFNDDLICSVASTFSYVRFDYAEGIQGDSDIEPKFVANLNAFLANVGSQGSEPSVGLKLLLSKKNVGTIIKNLLNVKKDLGQSFNRINHIRIRPMRSQATDIQPDYADPLAFRNEFFDEVFTYREDWPKDIKVDLDLQYVSEDFKCRLSPMYAVVDPSGSLLSCCNYIRDQKNLTIGDLRSARLEDVWGSARHRNVVKNINTQQVCNARNGCPCRFVRYQKTLERTDRISNTYVPPAIIEGFL